MSKKVSTKTLEALTKLNNNIPATLPITYKIDDKEIIFNIKTSLSIAERSTFISRVCDSVFYNGELHIEYFEPLFDVTLLQMFVLNCPVFQDGEILNIDKTYEMCKALKIRETITETLINDVNYIRDLYKDCRETLEFNKAVIINKTSPFSDLIDMIQNVVSNFDPKQYENVLPLINKLNQNGVDKQTLVDAFIDSVAKKGEDNVTPLPTPISPVATV